MKVLLILCVLIAPFIVAEDQIKLQRNKRRVHWNTNLDSILAGLEQQNSRPSPQAKQPITSVPLTPKKDPWLTPAEGILVNEHTRVYRAERGSNNRVSFNEIPRAIVDIALPALSNETYQKASVENINNAAHILNTPTVPASTIGEWPQVLYPKLMVVVAYDLYQKFGENLADLLPYVFAFWNGVDTVFRSIENPKIRLNIAKIVIETRAGVLDYLSSDPRDIRYLPLGALSGAQTFWQNHKDQMPFDGYDMAVSMTMRSTCTTSSGPCTQTASGTSKVGGMCKDVSLSFMTEKVMNVADSGKFDGILSAAHELGHTLGMQHDQLMKTKSDEALRETPSCKNVDYNHIMDDNYGPSEETPYKRRWSKCSLEQLAEFIKNGNPTCLYNPPRAGDIHIPRLLPGKLATLDDYCQSKGFSKACSFQNNPCKWPYCEKYNDAEHCYVDKSIHTAEGTHADENNPDNFCFFGESVSPSAFT